MPHVTITPIPALKDNYIWIITNEAKTQAIVVDPGDAAPVLHYLNQQQLKLSAILITHHHWDHTNGLSALITKYQPVVYASAISKLDGITHYVRDTDKVEINSFPQYRILEIPGHTLDHIAYYDDESLFCGDTLFSAGCGRVFEGTMPQFYASLQKLAALADNTNIYCGHEYTLNNLAFALAVEPGNTIAKNYLEKIQLLRENQQPSLPSLLKNEKQINPFLRCHSKALIKNVETYLGRSLNSPLEVFTELRTWKNNY